ncbi:MULTISPECIES: amidase [unclassified Brevibacterium]|uniref:amidase n=1 Tax=unclassified Brevibacterium TaxID=2614124 RepID=UPI0010931A43|nr:amidase family protein [Brevibacterium sp. S22]TGD32648.1 hypothetical protein EB835_02900 [Brevibacterium sp. S22]
MHEQLDRLTQQQERTDSDQLYYKDASSLCDGYSRGSFTPVDVVKACIDRIAKLDGTLNAMVHLDAARAIRLAEESEDRYANGLSLGPLDGVPVTLKESVAAAGWPVSVGSAALDAKIVSENAPLVDRLLEAGAVLVGTTRMPDHGWKGVTNGPLGAVPSPWDLNTNAGGSSGGAAAGLAAGYTPIAIGSDGAGSIRFPAAYCGVVGLKPTYGRVAAFPRGAAGTLTHYGPMARSVGDVESLFKVVAQPDERDYTCSPVPDRESLPPLTGSLKKLRVYQWVAPELTVEKDVLDAVNHTAELLEAHGATVHRGQIDTTGILEAHTALFAGPMQAIIDSVGPDRVADLDPEMVKFSRRASDISVVDFIRAQQYRSKLAEQLTHLQQHYDVILSPVSTTSTAPLNAPIRPDATPDRSPFAFVHNLTGRPALTIPIQLSQGTRPVGIQLSGRRFEDEHLLQVGRWLERFEGTFLQQSSNGKLLDINA